MVNYKAILRLRGAITGYESFSRKRESMMNVLIVDETMKGDKEAPTWHIGGKPSSLTDF